MTKTAIAVAALAALLVSPAYAQKAKTSKASAKVEAEESVDLTGVLVVSDRELNTFKFNQPVKKVIFPSGLQVPGAPIYLPGNETVVIEFGKSDTPLQMVVVFEDGSSKSLRLLPRPVKGSEHSVGPAKRKAVASSKSEPSEADARAADMELLRKVVMDAVPQDFESIVLPKPVLFDKFKVVPLRGWTNNVGKRVMVFALVANPGQTAVVAPPQFYRAGITAVMVDGDVVDANTSPTLYVVEETGDE